MERKRYRFVGTEATIGERRLARLGDVVELADDEVDGVIGETGLPVVAEEQFEGAGFTAEELRKYGTFGGRAVAPRGFWDKLLRVQSLVGVALKVVAAVKEVKR